VKRVNEVQGVVNNETPLEKGDILVLYGDNDDIKSFIRDSNSEE
jgi:K+/H+ antiporter YhaU regulatory subunit KhtT